MNVDDVERFRVENGMKDHRCDDAWLKNYGSEGPIALAKFLDGEIYESVWEASLSTIGGDLDERACCHSIGLLHGVLIHEVLIHDLDEIRNTVIHGDGCNLVEEGSRIAVAADIFCWKIVAFTLEIQSTIPLSLFTFFASKRESIIQKLQRSLKNRKFHWKIKIMLILSGGRRLDISPLLLVCHI